MKMTNENEHEVMFEKASAMTSKSMVCVRVEVLGKIHKIHIQMLKRTYRLLSFSIIRK